MRTAFPIVTVLFLTATAGAQETIELKPTYVPGQFLVVMSQDMQSTTEFGEGGQMAGQQVANHNKQSLWMQIDIADRDASGQQAIRMTYKRMAMEVQAMGMTMKYDSADRNAAASPLAAAGAMVGQTITMTVDDQGAIIKVEGVDEMFDAVAGQNPGTAGFVAAMKKQFPPNTVKQMVSAAYQNLPDKPVAKGETWTKQMAMDVPLVGRTAVNTQNQLTDIQQIDGKTLAVIEFTGDMKGGQDQMQAPGGQITMSSMTINQKGRVQLDVANTMVSTLDITMTGTMEMTATASQTIVPMSITLNGKVRTTTEPGVYVDPEPNEDQDADPDQ